MPIYNVNDWIFPYESLNGWQYYADENEYDGSLGGGVICFKHKQLGHTFWNSELNKRRWYVCKGNYWQEIGLVGFCAYIKSIGEGEEKCPDHFLEEFIKDFTRNDI